jgi:hypothetical protein
MLLLRSSQTRTESPLHGCFTSASGKAAQRAGLPDSELPA